MLIKSIWCVCISRHWATIYAIFRVVLNQVYFQLIFECAALVYRKNDYNIRNGFQFKVDFVIKKSLLIVGLFVHTQLPVWCAEKSILTHTHRKRLLFPNNWERIIPVCLPKWRKSAHDLHPFIFVIYFVVMVFFCFSRMFVIFGWFSINKLHPWFDARPSF